MTYNYALMLGGALAKRFLTYKMAERYNVRLFSGRGVIIEQTYVTGVCHG